MTEKKTDPRGRNQASPTDSLTAATSEAMVRTVPRTSYDDHQRSAVYLWCDICGRPFYVTHAPAVMRGWRCSGCR